MMPTKAMEAVLILEAHFQELFYWERTLVVARGSKWRAIKIEEDSPASRKEYNTFVLENTLAVARDIEECVRQWEFENSLKQGA